MKRALVTGGSGFVGSNLVRTLLNDGWKVDVITRPTSNLKLLDDLEGAYTPHVFDGSINSIIGIISESSPDVVFHIASMVVAEHKPEQVEHLIASNITFASLLLEAMSISGVKKLINTSTFWEHYESEVYNPVNLYAATKHAFQNILEYYIRVKGFSAITLKLFDPYGTNDPRPKLLNLLKKASSSGETLEMSAGEQKIDLIHIDDVVHAYMVAAERLLTKPLEAHEVYGVGSGRRITLKELVSLFEEVTGRQLHVLWGKRAYRDREVMEPWSNYKKIPGWTPKISLKKGLLSIVLKTDQRSGA